MGLRTPSLFRSLRGRVLAFGKDAAGTTAIEIAMLVLPLTVMTAGAIDIGMATLTQTVVDGAAATATRLLRTGELGETSTVGEFKAKLCAEMANLLDCDDMHLDVRTFGDDWSTVEWPAPEYDEDGHIINFGYAPGGAGNIITVRILYSYTPLFPGLTFRGAPGMVATVVVKTEPY